MANYLHRETPPSAYPPFPDNSVDTDRILQCISTNLPEQSYASILLDTPAFAEPSSLAMADENGRKCMEDCSTYELDEKIKYIKQVLEMSL